MPETVGDVLRYSVDLQVYLLAAAAIGIYEWGINRLAPAYAPRDEPAVTTRQRVFFYTGIFAWAAVASWPLHQIGIRSLFMFHMIEHMTIALVVPPLVLLGSPWWFTRAVLQAALPALRILTKPLVALVLFNGTLAAIHAPAVVEAMVTNEGVHTVIHIVLISTAFLMWWPVIGPIPDLPRLAPFPRMGYLFLQSLVPTVPASFLTLADGTVYKVYETFPRLWGISVQADQTIGGLIMKLGGGAVLWTAIAITFFTWFAEEERAALPAHPG